MTRTHSQPAPSALKPRRRNLLGLALAAATSALAGAHPGINVSLKIQISDEEIRFESLLSADYIRQLSSDQGLALPRPLEQDGGYVLASEADAAAMRAALDAVVTPRAGAAVDGLEIKPLLREVGYVPPTGVMGLPGADLMPPDVTATLVFPTKGRPRQAALTWRLFPEDQTRALFGMPTALEVVAELDAYDENKLVVFSDEEPEIIWHAPRGAARERVWPVVAELKPKTVDLPAASAAASAAAGLVVLCALARRGRASAVRWATAGAAALAGSVGAYALRGVALVPFTPPWAAARTPPTAEEARQVFETLQRNVYRAFEYKTESDIYDVLAQSVDGPLLDAVYNEVHQSLVLRDQGGAVARIKQVDTLATDVLNIGEDEAGRIAVQCSARWQVQGSVFHWGHLHSRTNEYSALYTLATAGEAWKITAVQVLSHKRIVREGDDPLPMLKPPGGDS